MYDIAILPVGVQSFSSLRERGQRYVDKTAQIHELASTRAKILLTRPRRFGKTLLLSTFESLFAHGLRDFKGLAIEGLWKDRTYETIRLDFSVIVNFQTVDAFRHKFYALLSVVLGEHGFVWNGNVTAFSFQLALWLRQKPNNSLVLLIDEYDAPLTRTLDQPALFSGIQRLLGEFFHVLKSEEACLRFFFMTGITRVDFSSMFSGFNSVRDISQEPAYGTLLGFTEDELTSDFGDYLRYAAQQLQVTPSELVDKLREYYGGYSFDDEARSSVCCPWSILNFFLKPPFQFENYWFPTGGEGGELMRLIAQRKVANPLDFLQLVPMNPETPLLNGSSAKININALLHQTGYLTIRSVNAAGNVLLGYPNREVAESMARLYTRAMVQGANILANGLLNALFEGNVSQTIEVVNQIFKAFDFSQYPIRDEASFRGVLQILMLGLSLRASVDVHTSRDRSDIEVEVGDYHWVFELECATTSEEAVTRCQEAVRLIEGKACGQTQSQMPHGIKWIRVALVFNEFQRKITDWQQV